MSVALPGSESEYELEELIRIATLIVSGSSRSIDASLLHEYERFLRRINVEPVPPESIDIKLKFDLFNELIKRGVLDFSINRVNLRISYFGLEDMDLDDVQRVIAYLQVLGVVNAYVKERVISCPTCGSNRISVHLVCPNCGSRLLRKTRIIHHRACGYVGKEEDFEEAASKLASKGESVPELVCPNCGMPLHTEGVDYDVIGEAYLCETCGVLTRRPGILFSCVSCGKEFDIGEAVYKGILAAEPTPLGESLWRNAALEVVMFIEELRRIGIRDIQVPAVLRPRAALGVIEGGGATVKALLRIDHTQRTAVRVRSCVTVDSARRYGDLDSLISNSLTWFLFDAIRRADKCAFIVLVDDSPEEAIDLLESHGVLYGLRAQLEPLGRDLVFIPSTDIDEDLLELIGERSNIEVIFVSDTRGPYERLRRQLRLAARVAAAVLGAGEEPSGGRRGAE